MRRIILATAVTLALASAGMLAPGRAEAMTLPAPADLAVAIDGTNLVQDAAYVCRRVRHCGPNGCSWHKSCYWTGRLHRYWRHGRWYYY
jgi:predicted RNA-binding Zn ribbon-like protein